PVGLPVPDIGVDFEGPSVQAPVDAHGDFGEIGAGPAIPMTELHHFDDFPLGAGEGPAELAAKPASLQLQLVHPWPARSGAHQGLRLGPDPVAKGLVTLRSDGKGGAHASIIPIRCSKAQSFFPRSLR